MLCPDATLASRLRDMVSVSVDPDVKCGKREDDWIASTGVPTPQSEKWGQGVLAVS